MFLKQNDMVTPMNHKYVCILYKKKETYSLFIESIASESDCLNLSKTYFSLAADNSWQKKSKMRPTFLILNSIQFN